MGEGEGGGEEGVTGGLEEVREYGEFCEEGREEGHCWLVGGWVVRKGECLGGWGDRCLEGADI